MASNTTQSNPRIGRRQPAERAVRAEVNLAIEFQTLEQFFNAYVTNISVGGIFIRTSGAPPEVGERVQLKFSIPGIDEPVETWGEVAHRQVPGTDGGGGVGVRFADLDERVKAKIDALAMAQLEREDRERAERGGKN